MARLPLAEDTPLDVERLQIEGWRRMSPADKARLVEQLTATVRALALAGLRQRYPEATPRELFCRLAVTTLGREQAARVYPEIDLLTLA